MLPPPADTTFQNRVSRAFYNAYLKVYIVKKIHATVISVGLVAVIRLATCITVGPASVWRRRWHFSWLDICSLIEHSRSFSVSNQYSWIERSSGVRSNSNFWKNFVVGCHESRAHNFECSPSLFHWLRLCQIFECLSHVCLSASLVFVLRFRWVPAFFHVCFSSFLCLSGCRTSVYVSP